MRGNSFGQIIILESEQRVADREGLEVAAKGEGKLQKIGKRQNKTPRKGTYNWSGDRCISKDTTGKSRVNGEN